MSAHPQPPGGVVLVGLLSLALTLWLWARPVAATDLFQSSPPGEPTATLTATPFPSPTPSPSPSPTALPTEAATPTETPTATTMAAQALPPGPDDATPTASLRLPADVPLSPRLAPLGVDRGMAPALPNPELRAIVLPTPTAPPSPFVSAMVAAESAVAALAWIWLVGGVLLFFVAAGLFLGLTFYRPRGRRYHLELSGMEEMPEPWAQEPIGKRHEEEGDDSWPSSLP